MAWCLLGVLLLAHSARSGVTCPKYNDIATDEAAHLDTARYEGFWYEVYSHNVVLVEGCECTRYNFTMQTDISFTDDFTCHKKSPQAPPFVVHNKGKVDATTPGKMTESLGPASPPYWVLGLWDDEGNDVASALSGNNTAYHYALVYACVGSPLLGEYTYFFSRNSSIPDAQYTAMRSFAKDRNISLSSVKKVPMGGCTWA
jgi:lipocalin